MHANARVGRQAHPAALIMLLETALQQTFGIENSPKTPTYRARKKVQINEAVINKKKTNTCKHTNV